MDGNTIHEMLCRQWVCVIFQNCIDTAIAGSVIIENGIKVVIAIGIDPLDPYTICTANVNLVLLAAKSKISDPVGKSGKYYSQPRRALVRLDITLPQDLEPIFSRQETLLKNIIIYCFYFIIF